MTDLVSRRTHSSPRAAWGDLLEERFTNVDLMVLLTAGAFTLVVAVVASAALLF